MSIPAPSKTDLVEAVRDLEAELVDRESRKLVLVAAMCDTWSVVDPSLYDSRLEGELPPAVLFGERLLAPGSEGTPQVAEFLSLELGMALQVSPDAAWRLMGDVLNLRHRLPILWENAINGRVRAWAARRVAQATTCLSSADARRLDSMMSPKATAWTPAKLLNETERLLVLLDSDRDERRARARAARSVRIQPGDRDGHAYLEASLDAAHAVHLDATLDAGARALATGGMTGSHDELRSETLGLLAHPARAHLVIDRGLPFDDTPVGASAQALQGDSIGADSRPAATSTAGADVDGQPGGSAFVPCRHGAELVVRVRSADLVAGLGGTLDGFGPLTGGHLARLLADCARVVVRPVVDLTEPLSVAGYAPSPEIKWRVAERDQKEVWPFSNRPARSRMIDQDHTIPHARGGPTDTGNLGSLSRKAHRALTFTNFRVTQVRPGVFCTTTPTGQRWWTDPHGNHDRDPADRIAANNPADTTTATLRVVLPLLARAQQQAARQARCSARDQAERAHDHPDHRDDCTTNGQPGCQCADPPF